MRLVDYMSLISPLGNPDWRSLSEAAAELKRIPAEIEVPILINCQPKVVYCKSCGSAHPAGGTSYYVLHGIITKGASGGILGSGTTFNEDDQLQEVHIYCPECLMRILTESLKY